MIRLHLRAAEPEPDELGETSWGVIISVIIHGVLLGLVLLAYRERPEKASRLDQFVTFLVPPDKPAGQAAATELRWTPDVEGQGTGGAGTVPKEATGGQPTAAEVGDSAGPGPSLAQIPASGDTVLTELEVDSIVVRDAESGAPEYPARLLAARTEGSVFVEYVVDTTGLADSTSFRVIRATHPEFADAVRAALPKMRFRPAMLAGERVRQLVQQPFTFKIRQPGDTVPPPALPRTQGVRLDAPD
jgi:protein TonB